MWVEILPSKWTVLSVEHAVEMVTARRSTLSAAVLPHMPLASEPLSLGSVLRPWQYILRCVVPEAACGILASGHGGHACNIVAQHPRYLSSSTTMQKLLCRCRNNKWRSTPHRGLKRSAVSQIMTNIRAVGLTHLIPVVSEQTTGTVRSECGRSGE